MLSERQREPFLTSLPASILDYCSAENPKET